MGGSVPRGEAGDWTMKLASSQRSKASGEPLFQDRHCIAYSSHTERTSRLAHGPSAMNWPPN